MTEKFVLVFLGGANTGIFGAGVGKGILDRGLHDRIHAIHGGSCGGFNATYLVAKQSEFGPMVYVEGLTTEFIYIRNIPFLIYSSILRRPMNSGHKIINVDRAIDLVKNSQRKLDIDSVLRSQIPVYITVWNMDKRVSEFIDIRYSKDPF